MQAQERNQAKQRTPGVTTVPQQSNANQAETPQRTGQRTIEQAETTFESQAGALQAPTRFQLRLQICTPGKRARSTAHVCGDISYLHFEEKHRIIKIRDSHKVEMWEEVGKSRSRYEDLDPHKHIIII